MARFLRTGMLLLAAGMLVASPAMANIPDPALSDCPAFIQIAPDGSLTYQVVVNGPQGPVTGANVEIIVTANADPLVAWCIGQAHPVISTSANVNGEADFNIEGGGCIDTDRADFLVAQVFADGILLCSASINSPDVVNGSGALHTDADFEFDPIEGDPNAPEDPPIARVGVGDAVFHTGPIVNSENEPCSDFTDPFDDNVGTVDAVIVTPFIVNAVNCNAQ